MSRIRSTYTIDLGRLFTLLHFARSIHKQLCHTSSRLLAALFARNRPPNNTRAQIESYTPPSVVDLSNPVDLVVTVQG